MAELEGDDAVDVIDVVDVVDVVPRVPIHHAPTESPRKKRGRPPKERPVVAPVQGTPPDGPTARRSHALDHAPLHSKIVVTDRGAVLVQPPDVPRLLPPGDLAHKLPVGAKIEKLTATTYRSTMLNPQTETPPALHESAIDAVTMFVAHFFPEGM